ncbi:hypothetical protein GCM10010842_09110 [Deinococcus daejeonensis]|uniref:Uncharacterized protein n=2 Tax=Deinococcus daejeonensis TaxID=1007098 RepID=A0ABQ2IWR9_9DEIO|nr:hypothetical protein GCM10010842_09110 [Deinococcus daejeonensis]
MPRNLLTLSTLGMLLSTASFAQTTPQKVVTCTLPATVTPQPLSSWNYTKTSPMGTMSLITPAQFPNVEKREYIVQPFATKCGDVEISSDRNTLTLTGPIAQSMALLTSPYRGKGGGDADKDSITLAFNGRYYYPNLRQDWSQDRVLLNYDRAANAFALVFEKSIFTEIYMKEDVVGARLDGGPLLPVFFAGKYTPQDVTNAKIIEIYAKGKSAAFTYMKLDRTAQVIEFKNDVAFPQQ